MSNPNAIPVVGLLIPALRRHANWMSELGSQLIEQHDFRVRFVAGERAEEKLAALRADALIACEDDPRARKSPVSVYHARLDPLESEEASRLSDQILRALGTSS